MLQTGKLPDQMILDNNDDSWFDNGDETPDGDLSGADYPLQLGKNLTGVHPSTHSRCNLPSFCMLAFAC